MIYRVIGFLIFVTFYMFYIAKLVILRKQPIRTNQMGIGNKPKKVLLIERIMSVATVLNVFISICSIIWGEICKVVGLRIVGIVIGVLAVIFFGLATITMKSSWRVGIPEEKTSLVTEGIYKWSRNPAFVGFDLLYLTMCLMFFNFPLLVVSIWAAVMLHLQILQEEEHMHSMFGTEYDEYKKHTMRYFGRR